MKAKVASVAGAPQMRILKYSLATASTWTLPSSNENAASLMGHWIKIKVTPRQAEIRRALPSTALTSCSSPAPEAWAEKPVVPILKNPKLQ